MNQAAEERFESQRAIAQWFFVNGFVTASWVAHVPGRAVDLEASPGALGLALLGMAVGSVIGMSLAPTSIRLFSAGRSGWGAGFIYALLFPLPLLAWSVPTLGISLVIFGVVHGLMDVAMNAAAAATEKSLGRPVMAGFHGWFSIGMVAGVSIGIAALNNGLGVAGHAAGVIGFAALLLLTSLPLRHEARSDASAAKSGGAAIEAEMFILAGLSFVCLFLEGAMADWAGLLSVGFGAKPEMAPVAYGAFTATWAGGRFIGDRLTAQLGDTTVMTLGALIASAGMTVALTGATPAWVAIGSAVVGFGLANTAPILFRAGASGDHSGRGLALVTGVGYFGFLVGPPLVGFMAEEVGLPRAMILVVVGGLILAAGSAAFASRRGRMARAAATSANSAKTSYVAGGAGEFQRNFQSEEGDIKDERQEHTNAI